MNIHEYQAKTLLAKFGVAVPKGGVAYTPQEAEKVAAGLAGPVYVVKAQIHAGGRGAGEFKDQPRSKGGKGGVRLAKSPAEVKDQAAAMLGHVLVTKQTGPQGREVKRVYIEEGCDIKRELYLGMLVDRATGRVTMMASTEGGMEIEEVAAKHPEKILRVAIDPATGFQPFHARELAYGLKLEGDQIKAASKFMTAMAAAFTALDASIVEINPLVVTGAGAVIALDAKINFDDNALFRHPDVAAMRDEAEIDPIELEAAKHELNYVKLDGNIGCMVNGAGLAMATMDIIKLYRRRPGQLPRRRRRRRQGARHRRLQADPVGPERRGHPGQHFRRHHALRRHRRRRRRRGARGGAARAAGGAPRRHQRQAGQQDPGGIGPADPQRRRPRRRRAESGQGREGSRLMSSPGQSRTPR